MLVDNLRHIAMITEIIDIARNKSSVNVSPFKLVQRVETFINSDVAFPCLTGSGGIIGTADFARTAFDVIDKLNEVRPDKTILLILLAFLFLGFQTSLFSRCLTFC